MPVQFGQLSHSYVVPEYARNNTIFKPAIAEIDRIMGTLKGEFPGRDIHIKLQAESAQESIIIKAPAEHALLLTAADRKSGAKTDGNYLITVGDLRSPQREEKFTKLVRQAGQEVCEKTSKARREVPFFLLA